MILFCARVWRNDRSLRSKKNQVSHRAKATEMRKVIRIKLS